MCGIVGVFTKESASKLTCYALSTLQHRGQDAAGIATLSDNRFYLKKDKGLIADVFDEESLENLIGNIGIGHARYPTSGSLNISEAQPFYVNYPYGIMLAHNGNLVNTEAIKKDISDQDFRHINTESDSEILINVLAAELVARKKQKNKLQKLDKDDIFSAITNVFYRCQGGYAIVAIIAGLGLLAFRDQHGIRPLILGQRKSTQGVEYMLASESVALSISGFEIVRNVAPAEVIYIDMQGNLNSKIVINNCVKRPCAFEYIYFARPDAFIDGISVYHARMRLGQKLGEKILRDYKHLEIDVVIPIPETGRTIAIELANILSNTYKNLKYREGFVKNRYVARTFIMPNQALRKNSVLRKLSPLKIEFENKNVLLVDDSIVRGTTSLEIIKMVRAMGAKKIYIASAAPRITHSNIYGIDMPTQEELIAYQKSNDEIKKSIAADEVIFQDLEDTIDALKHEKSDNVQNFETSIFDGEYIVGDITQYSRPGKQINNLKNNLMINN